LICRFLISFSLADSSPSQVNPGLRRRSLKAAGFVTLDRLKNWRAHAQVPFSNDVSLGAEYDNSNQHRADVSSPLSQTSDSLVSKSLSPSITNVNPNQTIPEPTTNKSVDEDFLGHEVRFDVAVGLLKFKRSSQVNSTWK
jgi:hypothetical protein